MQEVNPDPHPHLLNSRLIQQEPFFQLDALLGHIFFLLVKLWKAIYPGKHSQKGKRSQAPFLMKCNLTTEKILTHKRA